MLFPFRDDNPTTRRAVVTYVIVAVNVVALVWLARQPPLKEVVLVHEYGFVPARMAQLVNGQPLRVTFDEMVRHPLGMEIPQRRALVLPAERGQIMLSWLTTMFLHGGWWHLIGNMWFLVIFGNNVEDRLGHVTYLVMYLLGGLAATACHWAGDPSSTTPVIGASGAVAAVLGAYAVTWPWAKVRTLVIVFFILILDIPALVVLGIWFLVQLHGATAPPGMGENVAWWAHVGGFIAGTVLMPLLSALVLPRRDPQPHSFFSDDSDHVF